MRDYNYLYDIFSVDVRMTMTTASLRGKAAAALPNWLIPTAIYLIDSSHLYVGQAGIDQRPRSYLTVLFLNRTELTDPNSSVDLLCFSFILHKVFFYSSVKTKEPW